MAPDRKWLVLSHTHWDREWYLPYQELRLKLVQLMDRLQEILAGDPNYRHFMLDGQSIVLEDYLELVPWARNTVTQLVREKRLSIGPWYVLPDEFLVSGEALIRNLLIGIQTAEGFGGSMRVGYLPDQFGHIAQMPQILRGFNIDAAVVWRGVGKGIDRSEFRWRALDGSEVLSLYLAKGYFNFPVLPQDSGELIDHLSSLRQSLEPFATTDYLVVMNGCDHGFPQDHTAKVIEAANEALGKTVIEQVDLNHIIEHIRREIQFRSPRLPVAQGELVDSQRTHLLPGVLSSRMWIKQRNNACERLLEEWAEPFAAWQEWLTAQATCASVPLPTAAIKPATECARITRNGLKQAWRYLLQNQPHDSICGCSIDAVHEEMQTRYAAAEQIASSIARAALADIASQVNTAAAFAGAKASPTQFDSASGEPEATPIVVFNASAGPRTDFCSLGVHVKPGEQVQITDDLGTPVAVQTLSQPVEDVLSGGLDRLVMSDALETLRTGHLPYPNETIQNIGFVAEAVPGHGYRTYFLWPGKEEPAPLAVEQAARISNEFYKVEAERAGGTLTITDLTTGRRWPGLNRFVDGGDAGDEYNFDATHDDELVDRPERDAIATVLEAGPVRSIIKVHMVLSLPSALTLNRQARGRDRVECAIDTFVTLYRGIPRVEFRTVVENKAMDHRLRVHFPLGLRNCLVNREVHFGVVPYPAVPANVDNTWIEQPVPTRPQKRFLHAADGEHGLLLANRGLPEVEVIETPEGTELALTLLRCVGWLSRDDLRSRRGHAGPALEVPGAQNLGRQVFEYALVPGPVNWQDSARQAFWFNSPLRSVVRTLSNGDLPLSLGLVQLEPESLVISAIKPAENGHGLIVRFYNQTDEMQQGRIRTGFAFGNVQRTNLEEAFSEVEKPTNEQQLVSVTVAPWQIVTLRFQP